MNLDHYLNGIRLLCTPALRRRISRGYGRLSLDGRGVIAGLRWLWRFVRHEKIQRHNGAYVVNTFYPPISARSLERLLPAQVDSRWPAPVSVNMAVTAKCPYTCGHCSFGEGGDRELTFDEAADRIRQIDALGATTVGFTGGEPLLWPRLAEAVARASKNITTFLFTSGYDLDARTASELHDAGLFAVVVSLDHFDADVVRRFRPEPSAYGNAVRAIAAARRAGLYVVANATALPALVTGRCLWRYVRFAGELGAHAVRLMPPFPVGRAGTRPEFRLNAREIEKLGRFHAAANRVRGLPAVTALPYLESPSHFGCLGGLHHTYISLDGDVLPCDFAPLALGNVNRETLATAWRRMVGALRGPNRSCIAHDCAAANAASASRPVPVADALSWCASRHVRPPGFFVDFPSVVGMAQ